MTTRFLWLAFLVVACTNLDGVDPTQRSTFSHFYGSGTSRIAVEALPAENGGYIIAGNLILEGDAKMVIIKTDNLGKTIWEKIIDGGTVSALSVTKDGYIIGGDSIKFDPQSQLISELINTKARVIKMDFDGNVQKEVSFGGSVITLTDTLQIDYDIDATSFDNSGNLIFVGSYTIPGDFKRIFVSAHDPSSLNTLWINKYSLLNKDYVNGKSVSVTTGGNIVWTSSVLNEQQSFNKTYVVVPYAEPNSSSFKNNSLFGQTTDQRLVSNDIQSAPLGFAIVGSYAAPDGSNSNVFFARVDPAGNIDPASVKYFDGIQSQDNTALTQPDLSDTDDFGQSLAATSDAGYILAGTMVSTTTRGNGDKDIWLIKLDPFGNAVWNKLIGGTYAETASSVRQTSDGGYLICGTHTYSGLSQIFIVKTDANGELKN